MRKMHRCLTIIEVQHIIFQQIHDDLLESQPQRKATLARLARTCRALSDVALDVLWEELPSFACLIQCLPHDLWKVSRTNSGDKAFEFKRAMSNSDWDVFFRYSSRVQSLEHNGLFSRLDKNIIIALSQPPSCRPLAPNLKSLSWSEYKKECLPLLQSLLTHSLVNLALDCVALQSSEVLMHLISTCTPLQHFYIRDSGTLDAEAQKILSETLFPQLRSLETLDCPTVDVPAIINLSRLPSLTKFTGDLRDDMQVEHSKSYLTPPMFASLEILELNIGDRELSTLTSLLEPMRFKPRSMTFTMGRSPTLDMFHSFFIALANACHLERLSDISLSVDPSDWLDSTDRHQISLSTFEPLLVFPNVETFKLDAMCNISLDDDAINAMTKQWPKLTNLSFNSSFGWGIQSGVTLFGLILLLSRCPALDAFSLAVDFREIDKGPIAPHRLGNKLVTKCRYADFASSEIVFPVTIAAFLSDICPRLQIVSSSWDEDYGAEFRVHQKRWEEVHHWLPVFLAVRRQYVDSNMEDSKSEEGSEE